jgi:hypothetical protein
MLNRWLPRYPKPWLDNVKDDPDWEAAVCYISALLAFCAVVYYTSTVATFCELDIPSLNLIA